MRNLPEGLGDTYKRILIKISQSVSRAKLAQRMFKWAVVAKRPLHVEEFREAVAFEASDKSWSEDKIPHQDLMFECCRGLIIKDEDDQTVRFAHHTVQQYLTTGLSTKVETLFNISIAEAETFAGQICVGYLLFSDFETQVTTSPSKLTLGNTAVLRPGGPLWIPSVLGIRIPMFDLPYKLLQQNSSTRASEIDYAEHLNQRFPAKARIPVDLRAKYRLLPYIIDHWETHTRWFPVNPSAELYGPLWKLAIDKNLPFEFRPWGPNQHFGPHGCVGCPSPSTTDRNSTDLPHISMLHYAAEVGNMPLQLLVRIPDTRQKSKIWHYLHHERYHDETFLIACRHGRTEIVKYLMDESPLDVTDGRAVSAAATAGHAETLEFLLDQDQYPIEQQGDALLLSAAKDGHEAVVRVLAAAGANPNALDEQTGRTVMEVAAMNGHDSVLRTVIERGARPSSSLDPTTTALHLAAANGHVAATRTLLKPGFPGRETVDKTVRGGRTALHEAAESGHTAVAEVLLEYGADPMFAIGRRISQVTGLDCHIRTPIHLAAKGGHVKVLELFKKCVRSVDFTDSSSEETALHLAAAGGHDKTIRWLVENGANIDARDSKGRTPLYHATKLGAEATVRLLLELGARVVYKWARKGYETLSLAARHENIIILKLLLKNVREDQKVSYSSKRGAIVLALDKLESIAAAELLRRELELYPERKKL